MDMTFRKKLMLAAAMISLVIIMVSILVSSLFMNNYFKGYIQEQYNINLENIITRTEDIIISDGYSNLSRIDFIPFIKDPISGARIYDTEKHLVLNIEPDDAFKHGMMMQRINTVENSYILYNEEKIIGYVTVISKEFITDVAAISLFKKALLRGGLVSAFIVLLISTIIILKFSKSITKDLVETASFAKNIGKKNNHLKNMSKIFEIKTLQTVLVDLAAKTKLEAKNRKEKADKIRHEAKTPLTVLKSNLEGAADGVINMDRETIDLCIDHIDRLNDTLENLSEIVEYNSEKINAKFEDFDLPSEIRNIIKIMTPQFKEKGISLVYEGPEKLKLKNDKNLLLQSLYNLIVNSYKFSSRGTVRIKVEMNKDISNDISIEISDEGMGIDSAFGDKVFDAYFRAPNSANIEGEGLGLYIVRNNIQAMGGRISFKDNNGTGTIFIITLPQ
jgi:signal transduction histidine kinase